MDFIFGLILGGMIGTSIATIIHLMVFESPVAGEEEEDD